MIALPEMSKQGRRGYTPPPVPLLADTRLVQCGNCGKWRECAILPASAGVVHVCHDCLLALAEALSGVKWLNNWQGIKAAKAARIRIAKERRRDMGT